MYVLHGLLRVLTYPVHLGLTLWSLNYDKLAFYHVERGPTLKESRLVGGGAGRCFAAPALMMKKFCKWCCECDLQLSYR